MDFITILTLRFQENASAENAIPMARYMKDNFLFLGIKTATRRSILKEIVTLHKNEVKTNCRSIATQLFSLPEREYHYCAVDILMRELSKNFVPDDITLIEKLLVTHPWWDTVDLVAKYLLGGYIKHFPDKTNEVIAQFSASGNMWLNRSALLYQLGYKNQTDEKRLFSVCRTFSQSKEFFIQKAIGWALREYAKTNPEAVKAFVSATVLKPLSSREALKNI